jgi:hypothetical protein
MHPQQDGLDMQPPQEGFHMQPQQSDGTYMQFHIEGLSVQEAPEAMGFQLKTEVPANPTNGLEPADPCLTYLR